MSDNIKVQRIVDEDGRRVEIRTYETSTESNKEVIVERHVEQVPLALHERVIEDIVPVVKSRKKEIYKDGQVIDTVVEELESNKMNLSSSQSYITKEDLTTLLKELVKSQKHAEEPVKNKVSQPLKVEESVPQKSNQLQTWIETVFFVILSGELAFCLYYLVLKNWL